MVQTTGYSGIRLYIADLDAYNNGRLKGEWVDLPLDEDELTRIVHKHSHNGQQDHAIHDYEAPFRVEEFSNPWEINEFAQALADVNEREDVIEIILRGMDSREDALRVLQNGAYRVWDQCDTMKDVASAVIDEGDQLDTMPEFLQQFFDYEEYGRYLAMEGTFFKGSPGSSVYVEVFN